MRIVMESRCLRPAVGLRGSSYLLIFLSALLLKAPAIAQAPTPPTPKLDLTASVDPGIRAGGITEGAIRIEADVDGTACQGVPIEVSVAHGAVSISLDGAQFVKKLTASTNAEGQVSLDLDTSLVSQSVGGDLVFRADGSLAAGMCGSTVALEDSISFPGTAHLGFLGLSSERVATEFFLGTTFATQYDAEGNADGFGETDFLAVLRFDTLWKLDKPAALHTHVIFRLAGYPSNPVMEMGGDGMDSGASETPMEPMTSEDFSVEFADSFSAIGQVLYQPGGKWASYTKTNRDPDRPYDALRFGIFGRLGFTTVNDRTVAEDGQHNFMGLGLSLTHHRTAAEDPKSDNRNVFPDRFIECGVGFYEEIFGRTDDWRVVCDAGLRLTTVAKSQMPFYAGVHVNSGEGPDDLRLFTGVLFEIGALPKIFGR
ncbi:MAG: hypothetical protein AAGM22_33710 [Acidobacteriota bacterium]